MPIQDPGAPNSVASTVLIPNQRSQESPAVPLVALTGLRAVAALSVVIAHGSGLLLRFDAGPGGVVYWLQQCSSFGMTLFFVLSGFVIHYNYRTTVTDQGFYGIASFIWARFARLYPLFLLFLIIDVVMGHEFYKFMAEVPNRFEDVLSALPYFLTFTQSWIYQASPRSSLIYTIGTNMPLTWSISTEWFFYLAYPLLALVLSRLRRVGSVAAGVLGCCVIWLIFDISVVSNVSTINKWAIINYGEIAGFVESDPGSLQDSFVRWLIYFSPMARIGEFILGCLVCQLYLVRGGRYSATELRYSELVTWFGCASIPLLFYFLFGPLGEHRTWADLLLRVLSNNIGLAPAAALIVFCVGRYGSVLQRFLSSTPMVALGESSYSLYLVHFPIFVIAGSYIAFDLPVTLGSIAFQTGRLVIVTAIVVGISLALSTYVEAPSRRWLRRLWIDAMTQARWRTVASTLSMPALAAVLLATMSPSAATPSVNGGNTIRILEAT